MNENSSVNGCWNKFWNILGFLFLLGCLLKAVTWVFGIDGSVDPTKITSDTPEYAIEELEDLFIYEYAMYELDNSKINYGDVLKLSGEVEYVSKDPDELFINFKRVYLGGIKSASASAYFSNQEELSKIKKGGNYTIAGRLRSAEDYDGEVNAFGIKDATKKFIVVIDGCIVIK